MTEFYFGTELVLTLISSVTFLFSLCVIVWYLSVCVLCIGADFVIGLALLKRALWKFNNNKNNKIITVITGTVMVT
jgi:hypothetical protein